MGSDLGFRGGSPSGGITLHAAGVRGGFQQTAVTGGAGKTPLGPILTDLNVVAASP